jgi:predicted dehydrogenase
MPVKIHSHLLYGKWHDIEVEDDVTTYVEYENGATGVFITTTGDPRGTNRLEIQLDGAKIVAEDDKLDVWEFEVSEPEFNRTNTAPFGHIKAHKLELETDGKNDQHAGVINAWGGAILRGEPMVADGREGIRGLTLSNAMHLSSWLDQTIALPLDDALFHEELMKRVATSRRKENVKAVVADTSDTYGGAK